MARALIVIDVQNDYFAGGALPLWQAAETEARILPAIERARKAGDRVILIRHVSANPTGLFSAEPANLIRAGVLEAAGPDAPVVIKQVADSFQGTDLATHLDGIDELLISGMMTQNCVVFTAMSRAADGFKVRVLADLCAAPSEIVHKVALNALGSKLEVTTADQVWP